MTFLKNRPHGKKMGIIILATLIVISLAEVIFRGIYLRDMMTNTANYGEQIIVVILAAIILIFTAKGKDRICYLCYTAWIAYFVVGKIFSLPARLTFLIANPENLAGVGPLLSQITFIIGALCIIGIGVLLIEYMNDGTIYNKAFNTLCAVTIVMLFIGFILPFYDVIFNNYDLKYALVGINNLHQILMVFLFIFFAYDSAKMQLEKANLSK